MAWPLSLFWHGKLDPQDREKDQSNCSCIQIKCMLPSCSPRNKNIKPEISSALSTHTSEQHTLSLSNTCWIADVAGRVLLVVVEPLMI
jgi:hypothetical protein